MNFGDEMIDKETGKRIHKAREEAGLSQEELASLLGYTQSALSNYELGKRRLYLSNLEKIARVLNKPLTCFFGEPGDEVERTEEGKGKRKEADETVSEIIRLLSKLPEEERRYLLDYIHWMIDRKR